MKMKKMYCSLMTSLVLLSGNVHATTTGSNPWETTLTKILDSLSGPVAYGLAGIAIIISGLTMAFADLQGGAKKVVQAGLGISIAVGATTIVTSFLGFSGALI